MSNAPDNLNAKGGLADDPSRNQEVSRDASGGDWSYASPDAPTARFNRVCGVIGLAFLLLSVGVRYAQYAHRGIDQSQDFAQYYMGALMALSGEWDAMYPIPRPGALTNAGFSDSSDLHQRYLELAKSRGVGDFSMRFMQPPPCALLLAPLALLPYRASHLCWTLLLIVAAWGVARQAGEFHARALGRVTRWVGVLILLVCLSPQAHRWVRVGNLSVLIAWLIGFAVLEISRRDSARAAAAIVVGSILKYALLVLAPLLLAARRWRTLAWSIALGAAMLLASWLIMGSGPFTVFFRDIAPTLSRSTLIGENQALYRVLLDQAGAQREDALPRSLEMLFLVLQIGSLLTILAIIFTRRRDTWNRPAIVFAAALSLVAWLLIFSPIFWEHYHAYLAPFWGWLIYQAARSRLRAALGWLAIALAYLPSSLIAHRLHMQRLPEPFFSHLLWSAVIMLVLSTTALLSRKQVAADS
jgi:hypothetical protein